MYYSRAVGHCQSGSLGDSVGLVALHDSRRSWAVCRVGLDGLRGSDPDGDLSCGVVGWRRSNVGRGSWLWGVDWVGVGAWAISDCESL